jgi:hypothetical protein
VGSEIENFLGFEPEYPRKKGYAFDFSAGCFEKVWIKNCLSVGISAGFVEPLEATSIMQTILTLQRFMTDKQNLYTKNNSIKQKFNDIYLNETEEIVDFLYLHYTTNKNNTEFWKNFTTNNKMSQRILYVLEVFKDKVLVDNFDLLRNKVFSSKNYHYILIGNKLLDSDTMKKNAKFILNDIKKQDYKNILNNQDATIPILLTHNDFIDILKTL